MLSQATDAGNRSGQGRSSRVPHRQHLPAFVKRLPQPAVCCCCSCGALTRENTATAIIPKSLSRSLARQVASCKGHAAAAALHLQCFGQKESGVGSRERMMQTLLTIKAMSSLRGGQKSCCCPPGPPLDAASASGEACQWCGTLCRKFGGPLQEASWQIPKRAPFEIENTMVRARIAHH